MKKEAVFHINTEDCIYPVSRDELVVRLRTGREDMKKCRIIYWNRTDPDMKKEQQLECYARDELFDYYQTKLQFTKVARYQKYYFELEDKEGTTCYYAANGITHTPPCDGYFEFLYANPKDVLESPEWAKGIIYYQIFPERFCDGDITNNPAGYDAWGTLPTRENYMGGDLKGICDKVEYLEKLGVECLYLTPIFKGDFNHKYATTDYFEIDPMFGTKEDLHKLVDKCHRYGIKILLDGVFNHTGIHFAPFEDLLKNQEHSRYKDWFFVNKIPTAISHRDYECVGAYKWMPKLNTANKEVREFILSVMDYWIREYHIDGWRLDVPDEVDSTVWQEARLMLKEKYPDIILLGETWGYGGRLLRGNQMDSVMNYIFRDAVRDYFGKEIISSKDFDARVNAMLGINKSETSQLLYNPLDSHDTERFLFYCGGDKKKMKLAVAFQLLFGGSPAIFYGDEVGIDGDNDPDCRKCMVWDETADNDLFEWYWNLIQIRKQYDSIRKGDYHTILFDEKFYGFKRTLGQETLYVLLHKGEKTETVNCPVLEKGTYIDILSNEKYESESIEEKHFYNEDIVDYQAYIPLKTEPYSIKVIKKI